MAPIRSQPFIRGSRPSPLSVGSSNHGSLVQEIGGGSQDMPNEYSMGATGAGMGIVNFGHNGRMLMNAPTFNIFQQVAPLHGAWYPETIPESSRSGSMRTQSQSHQNLLHGISDAMKLLYERSAPAATYNAKERFDAPKCHERTRIRLLSMLHNWINGYNSQIKKLDPNLPQLTWLWGPVGTGKSAIAQTVSEEISKLNNLAASFFFSRTAPAESHRGDERHFIATIASQLTAAIPGLRSYVEHAIANHPPVFDLTLSQQAMALIIEPLRHLKHDNGDIDLSSIYANVIVVDGLDECKTEAGQEQVLEAIATLVSHPEIFRFSVLLASRPELTIRTWIDATTSKHPRLIQTTSLLDHCDSDHDIEIYVNDEAMDIKQTHPFKDQIPANWPSPEFIKEVVKRATGQFIYAATVIKYIKYLRDHPTRRLENLLQNTIPDLHRPYADLDALYLHILQQAEYPMDVHRLLAFRIASLDIYDCGPESTHGCYYPDIAPFLEHFLSLPCPVDSLLIDLQSIIRFNINSFAFHGADHREDITGGETGLGASVPSLFYHSSFLEFLLDPRRSGEFYINKEDFDRRCTETTIQQLKEPNPVSSNENHIRTCFLVALQTEASYYPPYTDQISTQLSRWDKLDDMMLYDILVSLDFEQHDTIHRDWWKAFAPAVMRRRLQYQQLALQGTGLPQGLFDLYTLYHFRLIKSKVAGDRNGSSMEPMSIVLEIVSSAQGNRHHLGVNPWKIHPASLFHESDRVLCYNQDLFFILVESLAKYLNAKEKVVLQFHKWMKNFFSEKAATAVLYIKSIISLLDPSQESKKPPEMQAYFGFLKFRAGKHWRAVAACQYLWRLERFLWANCAISAYVISALDDLCSCFFPPYIVSSLEQEAFPLNLPDPECKTELMSLVSCRCILPRWYVLPAGFESSTSSRERRDLGFLHDYIHLYHSWNTQMPVTRSPAIDIGEDDVWYPARRSDNSVDIDVMAALELSYAIQKTKSCNELE